MDMSLHKGIFSISNVAGYCRDRVFPDYHGNYRNFSCGPISPLVTDLGMWKTIYIRSWHKVKPNKLNLAYIFSWRFLDVVLCKIKKKPKIHKFTNYLKCVGNTGISPID